MKCSDGILDKTRSRGNSPCLLAVGMEAGPMAALGHGQGSGGEIRARSLCPKPKELEGSRRREGGLGVQWLQFLDKTRSRGNSPCLLAVGMEAGPMAALDHGQGSGGKILATRLCALNSWNVGGGERMGEAQRL